MKNLLLFKYLGVPSVTDFWLIIVLSIINAAIVACISTKTLQVLQLSGYKVKGVVSYFKETKFANWFRLLFVSLLSGATLLITNILLDEFLIYRALKYVGLIFYFIFVTVYIINIYSVTQKTPIKYTKRMSRIVFVLVCLGFLISVGLLYVSVNYIPYFEAGGMLVIPIMCPILALVAHYITVPLEKIIAKNFILKAKNKLKNSNVTVIGVTGSYGKTSVKNVIAALLAEEYKVCVSPYSYNTPLGLSKTILENLEPDDKIFVAEMGARYVGDINELAQMVNPSIGVITGIGNQHMATFGSIENLVKTKGELTDYITEHGGTMIFNTDSTLAKEMYLTATCKKQQVGIANTADIYAEDIKCTSKGSVFTLVIDNKKYKNVTTVLLGEHNISNILVGVSVCKQLGVSDVKILEGISKLTATAHRLSLMPSTNALIVIDDAYNGSVEGANCALKVLSNFEGRKVVITPGLVELGSEQFNSNFEFGKNMSKVCDYVIICGIVNYEALSGGLEFGGMESNKILRAASLSQAVSILPSITNPGDVVLFENDLPDNYL